MLSAHEQQTWDEIEQLYDLDGIGPAPPEAWWDDGIPGVDDLPAAVVVGSWAAILLVLFGLVTAGSAVGGLTALGWLLWRVGGRARPATASAER